MEEKRIFDKEGYDQYGYNYMGFDKEGYNKNGYDIYGYNRNFEIDINSPISPKQIAVLEILGYRFKGCNIKRI